MKEIYSGAAKPTLTDDALDIFETVPYAAGTMIWIVFSVSVQSVEPALKLATSQPP